MASPGNQHCVKCIGTLSFVIDGSRYFWRVCGWRLSGQRVSTTVSRVLSDTDGGGGGGAGGGAGGGGGLPVWRGANMAQSQLMQRRRQDAQRVT